MGLSRITSEINETAISVKNRQFYSLPCILRPLDGLSLEMTLRGQLANTGSTGKMVIKRCV